MGIMINNNAVLVMQEYSESGSSDLMVEWQTELRLRQEFRQAANWEEVHPASPNEIEFARRSLYYGNQVENFWQIIFHHLEDGIIINWILGASEYLLNDFWHYLIAYLGNKPQQPDKLDFLVSLYQDRFRSQYIDLIQLLDQPVCEHLLARTTNQSFREILRTRMNSLRQVTFLDPYDLIKAVPKSAGKFPTLYGDKIENIRAAVIELQKVQNTSRLSSPGQEQIDSLLRGCDVLFRAGLWSDCLAIINKSITGSDQAWSLALNQEPYYKQVNQLLRRVVPIYSLIAYPAAPHRYALQMIRSFFPGFALEPISLIYLDLYSILAASLQGHRQYAAYELAQKASKVRSYRPNDFTADYLLQALNGELPAKPADLIREIEQKLPAQPHESLVTMGMWLWVNKQARRSNDQESANFLLNLYEQFYNWVPSHQFMNRHILDQLGRQADKKLVEAGEVQLSLYLGSSQAVRDKVDDEPMLKRLNKYLGVL